MMDRPDANWRLDRTYALIRSLQPMTLIGNNHGRIPHPGEDFQILTPHIGRHNAAGTSATSLSNYLPLQTSATLSSNQGHNQSATTLQSAREIIAQEQTRTCF
jgi:alpha-L-fucosidase